MKILLLAPAAPDPALEIRIGEIEHILQQLGHSVVRQPFNPDLYSEVMQAKPDVVFNLASVFSWEKTAYIPAILEIAGVRYTGSGFLTLSLARNPTMLMPLLEKSGIALPSYLIVKAGDGLPAEALRFPLQICRNDVQAKPLVSNNKELEKALAQLPPQEEIVLRESSAQKPLSVYVLGATVLPQALDPALRDPALLAYRLLETRGLARFDFVQSEKPLLVKIDAAPDPLHPNLLKAAASAGLDATAIIRRLLEQAGSD